MIELNTSRRRILRRAVVGLASVVVGAVVVAVQSADFREFVGDSYVGSALLVIVPALVLGVDKWLRERKNA